MAAEAVICPGRRGAGWTVIQRRIHFAAGPLGQSVLPSQSHYSPDCIASYRAWLKEEIMAGPLIGGIGVGTFILAIVWTLSIMVCVTLSKTTKAR